MTHHHCHSSFGCHPSLLYGLGHEGFAVSCALAHILLELLRLLPPSPNRGIKHQSTQMGQAGGAGWAEVLGTACFRYPRCDINLLQGLQ